MGRKLSPLKIVILYAIFGLSWILFSDLLLSIITKDPEIYTEISIAKGWLYVVLTAALLYWLVSLYSKQRTQSEIALHENEQRFRAFFEAHGSVMMLIDPDTGGIVDANGAAANYYGFTRDMLRSMAISDINMLPPEELMTQRSRATGNQYNLFVVPHRLAGGEIRTVEVHTSPIEVNQKKLLFSIIHDITERKRAEDALQLTRFTVDNVADAVYWMDSKAQIVDVNETACSILGYTRGELLNLTVFDIDPDFTVEKWINAWEAVKGQGKLTLETKHRTKEGRIIPVEIMANYLSFGGRELDCAFARDISQRKLVEEALRASRERFRSLVESTSDWVWEVDEKGVYTYASPQIRNLLGYAPEEVVGKTPFDLMPEDEAQRFSEIFKSIATEKKSIRNLENINLHKDGRLVVLETSGIPFYDSHGNLGGYRGIGRDITERKRAEMELEKYRDHLEELVAQRAKEISVLNDQLRQSQKLEAVGILAGGIAHEFSNILATMKGSMYLIQKRLPEGSQVMKYAEQILASMKKANTLSQGLLTFSRKQKISLKPVRLNGIIRSVGKMLSQLIGEDIELAMTLSDENPTVMADMNQIEQVLINLVTNARDAMPAGGRLSIGTGVMKMDEDFKKQHGYGVPGEYVVLTVSDSGTGMEEAIRGKIFEPFFTTKVVGKGSGLGLAVTYGIVKQHKGFIDVESIPGEGTTFKIYFPTVKVKVIQPVGQDISPTIGGSEMVLLAEDDEDARTIMGELLRMGGYTVLEAGNGEEAIRVYRENKDRLQLVFLDVRMPQKNGREVYEEIKQIHPATKFLFMSGYTADIIDSLGVGEEGINFISKAASPDEILRKIREVLDG